MSHAAIITQVELKKKNHLPALMTQISEVLLMVDRNLTRKGINVKITLTYKQCLT